MIRSLVTLLIATAVVSTAQAGRKIDLKKDFDSLGGNEAIVARAKVLDPNNRVQVVQNRVVNRHLRVELGVNYGMVAAGGTYLRTQNLGGNFDFHINPNWSIGFRYYQSLNDLTNEGKEMYDLAQRRAQISGDFVVSEVDPVYQTGLAVVSWYPIYGKMNLFNAGVTHFDVYALAGYGKAELTSGVSDTLTAGAGVGFWISQYVASRFEVRYQTYEDLINSPNRRRQNIGVATMTLGVLL
jgi:outer membrane beta-barrel protein